GRTTLHVAFVNDDAGGGEDRNCEIASVALGAAPWRTGALELPVLPPALVAARAGGGRVVVDTVRWDRPGGNRVRAGRYASALLRNLGAAFVPPAAEPDWIPAAGFRPVGSVPNFSAGPGGARFGSNGTAAAPFRCAA